MKENSVRYYLFYFSLLLLLPPDIDLTESEGSYLLNGVTVVISRVDGEAGKARGHREKSEQRPREPQRSYGGLVVLHGEVALHLHLIDSVQGAVDEDAADSQGEPGVPCSGVWREAEDDFYIMLEH